MGPCLEFHLGDERVYGFRVFFGIPKEEYIFWAFPHIALSRKKPQTRPTLGLCNTCLAFFLRGREGGREVRGGVWDSNDAGLRVYNTSETLDPEPQTNLKSQSLKLKTRHPQFYILNLQPSFLYPLTMAILARSGHRAFTQSAVVRRVSSYPPK